MKKYNNWNEVFEVLTEEEKAEIRRVNYSDPNYLPNGVDDEKIIADVEQYFDDNIGESEDNAKTTECLILSTAYLLSQKKISYGH